MYSYSITINSNASVRSMANENHARYAYLHEAIGYLLSRVAKLISVTISVPADSTC